MSPKIPLRKRTRARPPRSQGGGADGDAVSDIVCEVCGCGGAAEVLLLCDQCDRGFHTFCLRPILVSVPSGSWFCPSCSRHKRPRQFPLVQTKIVDFFRIQRCSMASDGESRLKHQRRKRAGPRIVVKRKRKLLPFIPSEDPARRMAQMASLATALTATGAKFSDELTYVPGMAPRSANRAALEREGMQVLSREDAETLNLCKRMMGRGECPPLMVAFDAQEGFTVEADRFIRDLTIIAEYAGDVDFLKNREDDDGDSMMTLMTAVDPAETLVICPDKRGNVARFINGINNHTPEGKKKQNLKCVRFDVDGECRALLIASRDIRRGERLYYDYNGYEQEYPTQHFL